MKLQDLLKKTMAGSVLMAIYNFETSRTLYYRVYDYEIDDKYKDWEVVDIDVYADCLYIRIKEAK